METVLKIEITKVIGKDKHSVTIQDQNGLSKTITVKSDKLNLILDEVRGLDGQGVYR